MTSIKIRNSFEEEKYELLDYFNDFNLEFKNNIWSKDFLNISIRNVSYNLKEKNIDLNKLQANNHKHEFNEVYTDNNLENIKKDYINLYNFTNQCNKDAKILMDLFVNNILNKIKNEKKNKVTSEILFNPFEFKKNNKENATNNIAKRFIDISFKNIMIKLRVLEKENIVKKNSINLMTQINENKNQNYAVYFITTIINQVLSELNSNLLKNNKKIIKKKSINKMSKSVFNINYEQESLITEFDNKENICNQFTRKFFNNQVRKTLSEINKETCNEITENFENDCYLFSKKFLNEKFRKTVSEINTNINIQKENNQNSENRRSNLLNSKISKSKNNYDVNTSQEENKIRSESSFVFIKESLNKISNLIDEKVTKKLQFETFRNSKYYERKLHQERLDFENDIKLLKNKNTSINFWRNCVEETMIKYNDYHKKLVKCTIRIQKNFRRHLWRFIIKIELMNLQIEKENEKAMAAYRKRKISSLDQKK